MTSSVLRAICKELDGQESCGGFLLHQIKSVYVIFQRILQAHSNDPRWSRTNFIGGLFGRRPEIAEDVGARLEGRRRVNRSPGMGCFERR